MNAWGRSSRLSVPRLPAGGRWRPRTCHTDLLTNNVLCSDMFKDAVKVTLVTELMEQLLMMNPPIYENVISYTTLVHPGNK